MERLKELLKYYYKLNDTQVNIILALNKASELSVKEIGKDIKKERTTVTKSVNILESLNLVKKRQINLERGFMFVYSIDKKKLIIGLKTEVINKSKNDLSLLIDLYDL